MSKSLTQQLVEESSGLLSLSPEVSNSSYSMADDGGVEYETGEFIYGLVRILKPGYILETGTYTGISALYIGQALSENDRGHLVTLEITDYHKIRAEKLWRQLDKDKWITCRLMSSLEYEPSGHPDLILLDSEPALRFQELVRFFPYLVEGGYILIHDLFGHLGQTGDINPDHPDIEYWPFNKLPDIVKKWLEQDIIRVIPIPAPRGLVLFYKVKESDYKWE